MRLLLPILTVLLLLPGCSDEEDDRIARVGALVRDRDLDGLRALLDSDDAALKCRAASSLAWVTGEDAIPHHRLLVAWTDCGWKVQVEAAWRLAEEEAPDAADVAKTLLQSKDERFRWNGAAILAELTQPELRDTLESCKTGKGQEKFVGLWCDYGLCRLEGGRCSRPKMRTWEDSDDD